MASLIPNLATRSAKPRRAHVAVCPSDVYRNPEAFFLLSRRIADAAPDVQVTLFTKLAYTFYFYNYRSRDGDDNLNFIPVDDGMGPLYVPFEELVQVNLEEFGENLRRSMAEAEEHFGAKITHVVADAFIADVCRRIAEEKGVGWSAVWTSSATSLATYMHADEFRGIELGTLTPGVPVLPSTRAEARASTVDQLVPGFPPGLSLLDLPYGVVAPPVDHSPLTKALHLMTLSLPKAESVVINSFQDLESDVTSALLSNNFHLGGLFSNTLHLPSTVALRDINGVIPWLETHLASPGSVLYINLGYDHAPPQAEFTALAETLEANGVPFLWYIPSLGPKVVLPEGFVHRTRKSGQGKVVNTTGSPLGSLLLEMTLLKHKAVGAQLRLGSWSSVMESITSGVPLICRPLLFDQVLNAWMVEKHWGIGVALEFNMLTKETVEKALKRVMVDGEGTKIREKLGEAKKLAEEAAGQPNGSSAQTLNKFISLVTK